MAGSTNLLETDRDAISIKDKPAAKKRDTMLCGWELTSVQFTMGSNLIYLEAPQIEVPAISTSIATP